MDDTIAAMMEVPRPLTRGSDVARAEAQSKAAKRERRTDGAYRSATWVVLVALLAAIAKAVHLATLMVRFRPMLRNRFVARQVARTAFPQTGVADGQ